MRIAVATSSRSDFGLIRPILKRAFATDPDNVSLICVGRATLMSDEYVREGIGNFEVVRLATDQSQENLANGGETVFAFAAISAEVAKWLGDGNTLDWLLVPGDRFEIFAVTVAAFYSNVPVAHLFAGDRSEGGHQDDSVRHAVSKLAHVHFTATEDSHQRVIALGEEPWRVRYVGSPVVESVNEVVDGSSHLADLISPRKFNVLCTYHPITTEPEEAGVQMAAIIEAFDILQRIMDVAVLFTPPNNESGSEAIRRLLDAQRSLDGRYVLPDLGWKKYLQTLAQCDLAVGNSSSGMLEAPIVGVPALNVGARQRGRFSPDSVTHVEQYDAREIARQMELLLRNGRRQVSHPYGAGKASSEIYTALASVNAEKSRREILQKRITY